MHHTSVMPNWAHTNSFCTQFATRICTTLKDLWVLIWYPTPVDYAKWGKNAAKVRKRSTGGGAHG